MKLLTYQHPKEARTFYAPDVEPSLAVGVKILHLAGLDNYTLPHPRHQRRAVGHTAKATPNGSGPGGQIWGNDYRNAYVPGTTLTGAGQMIGLLELSTFYPADITNSAKRKERDKMALSMDLILSFQRRLHKSRSIIISPAGKMPDLHQLAAATPPASCCR